VLRTARDGLGALEERPFRLLFSATTVSTLGDGLGNIALVFAIYDLPGGTATDVGIVLATRSLFQSVIVVAGGVLSDRLPRNLVLVGASVLQGSAQVAVATLVLTGHASVWSLIVLSMVFGLGGGLVIPAEVGLVPQTVSAPRLQQANALQGLSRNMVSIVGPTVGGAIVAAGSPGIALAFDATTFFVAASLLGRIRIPAREHSPEQAGFFHELHEGWREFTRHTWLWSSVLLFGISNLVWVGCWAVLGPLVALQQYGGAGAWGVVLGCSGAGALLGGVVALRYRPRRPLLASVLAAFPLLLELLVLALYAPVWIVAISAFLTGGGIAIHLALWFTVFQREVPAHAQSRVSSYDALGSFVLIPLGMAIVGPVAAGIGIQETLWAGFTISLACQLAIVALPSVRAMRAPEPKLITVA
jgi:transmembrane secretion effector